MKFPTAVFHNFRVLMALRSKLAQLCHIKADQEHRQLNTQERGEVEGVDYRQRRSLTGRGIRCCLYVQSTGSFAVAVA